MYRRLFLVLFVIATILLSGCSQTGNVVKDLNGSDSVCIPKYDVNGNDLNSCGAAKDASGSKDNLDDIDKLLNDLENNNTKQQDTVTKEVVIENKTESPEDKTEVKSEPAAKPTTGASQAQSKDEPANFVKKVVEGDLVELKPRVVDPDGAPIQLTFSAPLDENGKWYTKEGDEGTYMVTVSASDGKSVSEQKVKIIVDPLYRPPVITVPGELTFNEGDLVVLKPEIKDPQDRAVKVTYSGWMTSDKYQSTYDDAGKYTVTITASNGKKESSEKILLTILNVNRAPVIEDFDLINVTEGDLVALDAKVNDPDGDKVTVTYPENFDSYGKWQTREGEAREYDFDVVASDGKLETTKTAKVIVTPKDKPPVLQRIPDITVSEGETVKIKINALDPNGDDITTKVSGWMTSDSYETGFDDQGVHTVTVTVSDGKHEVSQDVKVTVKDVNRAPVFQCIVDC